MLAYSSELLKKLGVILMQKHTRQALCDFIRAEIRNIFG
jgi:TnpA family transposase